MPRLRVLEQEIAVILYSEKYEKQIEIKLPLPSGWTKWRQAQRNEYLDQLSQEVAESFNDVAVCRPKDKRAKRVT